MFQKSMREWLYCFRGVATKLRAKQGDASVCRSPRNAQQAVKCLNCANLTLKPSPPRYKEDNVSSSDSDGIDDSPSDLTGDNFMELIFGEENEDEELW